ncbi:MAG: hypothetical protein EAZ42_09350, partial [Verrucomicrobia bacterium]
MIFRLYHWLAILAPASLLSCGTSGVTQQQALATAERYSQMQWMPEARHRLHGPDSNGIVVQTPDHDPADVDNKFGWWKAGVLAKGMPYQWGGFDSPESFQKKLAAGYYAGDIASPSKRRSGDDGVSQEACGIDCSGFVSRCWNLPRAYSTRELSSLCDPVASWDELQPGDMLLNRTHVLVFSSWHIPEKSVYAYEAGASPKWRVHHQKFTKERLLKEGYVPWRYQKM